ncbi:hypothetical protein H0H92_008874 [Tricholoma furcatifolium]|nr:hypothetical protein H0H92_008874 [Tricholoma furcatifolium]
MTAESTAMEDRMCPGCKKPAVSEQGGLVVAFGQSFFHVDCFKCAKCGDKVTADTNLLLLSDGSPICTNCTYSCNVCRLPILDEAIMTGDDSYHAHCFKCKVCKSRIDDLVFAKTSQGVYCMNCHNERMAKIRSHVQKKAEREREKRAGGSNSSKSRDRAAREYPAGSNAVSTGSRPSSREQNSTQTARSPSKPYVSDAFAANPTLEQPSTSSSPSPYASQSFSVTVAPPVESEHPPPPYPSSEPDRPNPLKQSTLPVLGNSNPIREERRRSYDDGVRPLDVLFRKEDAAYQSTDSSSHTASDGLAAPTSRRDKRRSINPGVSLSDLKSQSPSTLSPHSLSFPANISSDRVPTPPISTGRDSPHPTRSPLRDQFAPPFPSRPTSQDSLQRSNPSRHSSSSSGLPYSDDQGPSRPLSSSTHSQDQTIVVTSASMSITVGSVPPSKARQRAGSPIINPNAGGPQGGDARLSVGTKEVNALRSQRSFDDIRHGGSRPSSGASLSAHSQPRSRSVSPAHRPNVPHSVESESDTDPEGENAEARTQSQERLAPVPPPKDADVPFADEADASTSVDSGSEDLSESSPVEHISHSTFIAPALPPIRLSMTSHDFSELFKSVGGFPSRMSLSQLAKISEGEGGGILAPPPTAAAKLDADVTPTIQTPFLPPTTEESEDENDTIRHQDEPVVPEATNANPVNDMSESHIDDPLPTAKPLKVNGVFRRPSQSSISSSSQPTTQQNASTKSDAANLSDDGHSSLHRSASTRARVTLTEPDSKMPTAYEEDGADIVTSRLQDVVADARGRGAQQLKIDRAFLEAILSTIKTQQAEFLQLKSKFDGVKRTSKQYIEGLTVAQAEFDRELKARRDAEAEVTRLRVLLSGQVAKLTALSTDNKKEKLRQQLSKELHENLSGLELDLSNLKVERDMTLAEVEELEATRSATSEVPPVNLGRSLTKRLDNIKHQYKRDLVPLTKEKEGLQREIVELKAVRDTFLEETTVLNARNEELAQLSAAYSRRMETVPEVPPAVNGYHEHSRGVSLDHQRAQYQPPPVSISHSISSSTSSTLHDESIDLRLPKMHKQESDHTPSRGKFRWGSKPKEPAPNVITVDKKTPCVQQIINIQPELPPAPLPPSMFGRDLTEQVEADARGGDRQVPVIVEKCIQAVEAIALEYEGIYRKTGGTGQSKMITQLFERGDYLSFDLQDSDRFNDICSVTSVLKNYFRSLPVPLLTYDLHDEFMAAVQRRDQASRDPALLDLVNRLPDEHYYTLRMLMLHLHRVCEFADINKMNARNIGVVFGPTLMRSPDPAQEFSDMAGKALSVEWLVENAPRIFSP